jgi:hypothetical protein
VLQAWHNAARTGRRGKPADYTDTAILCMATLAEVYRLPLRATEGLTRSLLRLLGVELDVPDYTTLCRRRRALEVELPRRGQSEPLQMVVDSTGIKVYGEGEWKVRQHGYPDDASRDAGQLRGRGVRVVQWATGLRSSLFMQQRLSRL